MCGPYRMRTRERSKNTRIPSAVLSTGTIRSMGRTITSMAILFYLWTRRCDPGGFRDVRPLVDPRPPGGLGHPVHTFQSRETGAPSLEYTGGTFIENICMMPMWALFLLVPQIVGNILYPNPWSTLVCGKMTRWHSMESLTQDASSGRRRRGRTIESHRRRGWISTTTSRKGARWRSLGARSPTRPP